MRGQLQTLDGFFISENSKFIWIFACLLNKILTLDIIKSFILFSLNRILHYLWLRRKYSRSRKAKKILVFYSLIRTFAPKYIIRYEY